MVRLNTISLKKVVADTVSIIYLNETYVHLKCPQGISYELREAFTFEVPGARFTPAFKNFGWDGKIRLYDIRYNRIYKGLVPDVIQWLENNGYGYVYSGANDEFSVAEAEAFISTLNLPEKTTPRDYQINAFVHAIRNRRALEISPTASGKSLIIYLIIRYLLSKGLDKGIIIVPNVNLVNQMYGDFQDYGWNVEDFCHKIYQGKDKQSPKPIIISTWQSIYNNEDLYFKQFQAIIGDEVHTFQASSLKSIMERATNAIYRIGVTGTLSGSTTHELVLKGLFGPVHKVITTAELMEQGHLAQLTIKCILLKHDIKSPIKELDEEIAYLETHPARNRFIKNLALSLKGNTLVMFRHIEHGKTLYESINKEAKGRKVFFIYGKVDAEIREDIRKIIETEVDAIVVASAGTYTLGVNIKNLHSVIRAAPYKSKIQNLQTIGRTLRTSDTKNSATLFDIADDLRGKRKKENFTLKHFAARLVIYAEEKFQFKIYKVVLAQS